MNRKKLFSKKGMRDIGLLLLGLMIIIIGSVALSYQCSPRVKDYLNNVGIVLALVSPLISAWTWFSVRRLRDYFNFQLSEEPDIEEKEAILVISTKPDNVEVQVEGYLRNQEQKNSAKPYLMDNSKLQERFSKGDIAIGEKGEFTIRYYNKEDTKSRPILKVSHHYMDNEGKYSGIIPTEKMVEAVNYFKETIKYVSNALRENGVVRIRLFYAGIAVFCLYLGEEFSNNFKVSIYHHNNKGNKNNIYIYLGDL